MRSVGVKVLKNKLSEYLRLAASGETVLVTDRDRVVAELIPPREGRSPMLADALLAEAVPCSLVVKHSSPGGWHRLAFVGDMGEFAIKIVPAGQKSPRDPVHAPAPRNWQSSKALATHPSPAGWRSNWSPVATRTATI